MSNGIDGQGAENWPKVKHAIDDFTAVLQNLPPRQGHLVRKKEEPEATGTSTDRGSGSASTAVSEHSGDELESLLVTGLFKVLS
jgi:hypothetical protein